MSPAQFLEFAVGFGAGLTALFSAIMAGLERSPVLAYRFGPAVGAPLRLLFTLLSGLAIPAPFALLFLADAGSIPTGAALASGIAVPVLCAVIPGVWAVLRIRREPRPVGRGTHGLRGVPVPGGTGPV